MLQNLKSRKWLFSPVPEPAQKCENNVASFVHKIFLKWPLLVVSAFEGKSRFPLQNVFITLASWLSCRVYEPLFGVTTNLTALDDDGGTFGLIVKTENTKFYFILKTQKILRKEWPERVTVTRCFCKMQKWPISATFPNSINHYFVIIKL